MASSKNIDPIIGVSGIAHVASNVSFDPDPNLVIPGAVSSLHSILDSAAKSSTVESFVYTSSAAALAPPMPGVARRITAATFNEEDIEKAWAPPPYGLERAMSVYAASKVEAERALFTYAEEKKPHFAVKSIVLGVNFGKVLDWSIPASSGDFVKELLLGKPERAKQLAYRRFLPFDNQPPPGAGAPPNWSCRASLLTAVCGPTGPFVYLLGFAQD